MVAAAGPARLRRASALAAIFNLANFLTYLGVLLAGCWLLAELSARRVTLAAFALFAWLWPGWGEFTSGLYTISVYPQTMIFGFAAVALWLRGMPGPARGWIGLSLLAAAGSASLDISGVWIFPGPGRLRLGRSAGRTRPKDAPGSPSPRSPPSSPSPPAITSSSPSIPWSGGNSSRIPRPGS